MTPSGLVWCRFGNVPRPASSSSLVSTGTLGSSMETDGRQTRIWSGALALPPFGPSDDCEHCWWKTNHKSDNSHDGFDAYVHVRCVKASQGGIFQQWQWQRRNTNVWKKDCDDKCNYERAVMALVELVARCRKRVRTDSCSVSEKYCNGSKQASDFAPIPMIERIPSVSLYPCALLPMISISSSEG